MRICVQARQRENTERQRADSRELMWCHIVDNHWCACVCLRKTTKGYMTKIELYLHRDSSTRSVSTLIGYLLGMTYSAKYLLFQLNILPSNNL